MKCAYKIDYFVILYAFLVKKHRLEVCRAGRSP